MIAFIKLNTEKAKEEPWLEELCKKDRKKAQLVKEIFWSFLKWYSREETTVNFSFFNLNLTSHSETTQILVHTDAASIPRRPQGSSAAGAERRTSTAGFRAGICLSLRAPAGPRQRSQRPAGREAKGSGAATGPKADPPLLQVILLSPVLSPPLTAPSRRPLNPRSPSLPSAPSAAPSGRSLPAAPHTHAGRRRRQQRGGLPVILLLLAVLLPPLAGGQVPAAGGQGPDPDGPPRRRRRHRPPRPPSASERSAGGGASSGCGREMGGDRGEGRGRARPAEGIWRGGVLWAWSPPGPAQPGAAAMTRAHGARGPAWGEGGSGGGENSLRGEHFLRGQRDNRGSRRWGKGWCLSMGALGRWRQWPPARSSVAGGSVLWV